MRLPMIRTLLAAMAAQIASPALADTLVYNVDGITIDEEGEVKRFTQLVFDDEGVITHTLERGEELQPHLARLKESLKVTRFPEE